MNMLGRLRGCRGIGSARRRRWRSLLAPGAPRSLMTTSCPTVSVVTPTFGRWHFARTAVRAALAQEGVELEVIVIADGPHAADHGHVEELRDQRVRVFATPALHGVAAARNRGIDAARGDWIALLDDDDLWAPDKLRLQLAALEGSGADFAYSSAVLLDPDMRVRLLDLAPPAERLRERLFARNPIPACCSNLLVRASTARNVRFDPDLMHLADWDFVVRLALSAQGVDCPEVQVGYLHHGANMHYERLASVEPEFVRLREKHRGQGLRLGGVSQSRWVAGGYRESGDRLRAARAYFLGAVRYRSAPDLARAIGVLMGERAIRLAVSLRRGKPLAKEPAWLALYR